MIKKISYLLISIICLIIGNGCDPKEEKVDNSLNEDQVLQSDSYFVGSETCQSCHSKEFSDWTKSHHKNSMSLANETSVLGDFNNSTFTKFGKTTTFFRKGSDYFINAESESGEFRDYKIAFTFGFKPLQQYIIEFPDGKYQCLDIAWDAEDNKWFDLPPDLEVKPGEWLHWTGGAMNWNSACADCHSTNVKKNFDQISVVYQTTFDEINVGCESCHGPSGEHVKFYENPTESKPPQLYVTNNLTSTDIVQKCARCHSRRAQLTSNFDYNGHLLDHYAPSLLEEGLYHPDGQILDEVYVFGSFTQSKMYHQGVSCKDCHDVHSLQLKAIGNNLCLQCHDKKYDEPIHHFHKLNTEASQCVNCHMTGKFYMGNDFRRDHSFRVPRPDQSVKYGTPNACNGCHSEKNAEWAANFIEEKYGLVRPSHFSDLMLAGFHGDRQKFLALLEDEKYPDIARATALSYFSRELSPDEADKIKLYLYDKSVLVKNQAVLALGQVNSSDISNAIGALLKDSVRLIRISAAMQLERMSENPLFDNFDNAQNEYMASLDEQADFAGGQHNIAQYFEAKGDIENAINAYRKAIKIDNYYNFSKMNLALLLYNRGEFQETESLYLDVINQEPNYSYSHYMLGLLYNEMNQPKKALEYLKLACEKQPIIFKAFYNYSLLLQQQNQFVESIDFINQTLYTFPDNEQLIYVKLVGELKSNQIDNALKTSIKLVEIAPNNPNYIQIHNQIIKDLKK